MPSACPIIFIEGDQRSHNTPDIFVLSEKLEMLIKDGMVFHGILIGLMNLKYIEMAIEASVKKITAKSFGLSLSSLR